MSPFANTLFGASLLLSTLVVTGCGSPGGSPSDGCFPSGNELKGAVTVETDAASCSASLSGELRELDITTGGSRLQIRCTTAPDAVIQYNVAVPDVRALDAASPLTVSEQIETITNGSTIDNVGSDVAGSLRIVESVGMSAPMPAVVTDDFVRHFVVHLVAKDASKNGIDVDVAVHAKDVRDPHIICEPG